MAPVAPQRAAGVFLFPKQKSDKTFHIMAKSKSFFGLRKGSTKTLTFQVVNGAQVTKDRVAFVKNPRTESQMANRCLMATASAAYRAMREIVDHSFEGYTYGQQNMSQFIAQNITLLRNNAAIGATEFGYNRYRDRAFHPGAYKISKGSLTPTLYSYNWLIDDGELDILEIGGVLPNNFTVDDFAAALGLAVGEMTTICCIYGDDSHGWKFGFVRIKRIGMGNVPITTPQIFEAGFELTTNFGDITLQFGDNNFTVGIVNDNFISGDKLYSGVIYSRHTTQGWLRSTAYIEIPDGVELTPDYDTALATYPQGSNYILNGGTVSGGGRDIPVHVPTIEDMIGKEYPFIGSGEAIGRISALQVGQALPTIFNETYIIFTKIDSNVVGYNGIPCNEDTSSYLKGFDASFTEGSMTVESIECFNRELSTIELDITYLFNESGISVQHIEQFSANYNGEPAFAFEY